MAACRRAKGGTTWPGERSIDASFAALVAARWVHFVTLAALLGGAAFRIGLGRPRDITDLDRLLRVAAPLAAVSGFGWTAATIVGIAGDAAGLGDPALLRAFFLESPFGPVVAGRLALLCILVIVAWVPMRDGVRLTALAILAGLLLLGQAWLGHAAMDGASPKGLAMLAAYACHILAAAAWVGGLPPLLLALREARREGADARRLLRRVSSAATVMVAVLVAAGIANATFRIEALSELATTTYGRVLSVKLGLTAVMLALAGYNRSMVAAGREAARLEPSVTAELVLGALVLGAAAVLGVTPPPR